MAECITRKLAPESVSYAGHSSAATDSATSARLYWIIAFEIPAAAGPLIPPAKSSSCIPESASEDTQRFASYRSPEYQSHAEFVLKSPAAIGAVPP